MKVLQVPYTFHPDPIGGTEVYVEALTRHLRDSHIDPVIAAPGARDQFYLYEGLPVYRIGRSAIRNVSELYGEGDPRIVEGFGRVLDRERPDIVHLHAFTREISIRIAGEVKRRGIPLVFTYHIPTNSCVRQTLVRWGAEVCDGKMDLAACTACTLHGMRISKPVALAMASFPKGVGALIEAAGLSGSIWTAVRMKQLVGMRHDAFRRLLELADKVVVVCGWAESVLLRNGVSPEKIVCSRLGLCQDAAAPNNHTVRPPGGPLRVAFLGRLTALKGPDLLIRAVRCAPDLRVTLDVYGVDPGAGGCFVDGLHALSAGDPRIAFRNVVPASEIIGVLRQYDVLAAPSIWLETGPLVVLEAFAAGVPVIGSDLGGIRELVKHGVDGLLIEPNSVPAWCEALRRLCSDTDLLESLRAGIRYPRTMRTVAAEIEELYRGLAFAAQNETSASLSSGR